MYLPDLYDCFGLDDLRQKQVSKAWNISEFSKFKSVDLTKVLLLLIQPLFFTMNYLQRSYWWLVSFWGLLLTRLSASLNLQSRDQKKNVIKILLSVFPFQKNLKSLRRIFFRRKKALRGF